MVRLNRLENQSRQMAGQIESLQYENRQLKEQLRKFQEDVEFRFQEQKGGQRPAAATRSRSPEAQRRLRPVPESRRAGCTPGAWQHPGVGRRDALAGAAIRGRRRRDPEHHRRPRPAPAAIEDDTPDYGEPVDLRPPSRPAAAAPAPAPRPSASVAATGTGDAKADYEVAYAYVLQRQYEQAEMSLRQFIQSHPRDALVPDATYWLGESYLQRNRTREAAELFLKVSTDYARSRKAPDAMLKLGASLQRPRCPRAGLRHPGGAGAQVPAGLLDRQAGGRPEQRRARCAA